MASILKARKRLPLAPVVIWSSICLFAAVLFVESMIIRLNGNFTFDSIFLDAVNITIPDDPINGRVDLTGPRMIIFAAWTGGPLLLLAILVWKRFIRLAAVLFVPVLFISFAPVFWYYHVLLGGGFFDYGIVERLPGIVSLAGFVYVAIDMYLITRYADDEAIVRS